MIEKYKEEVKRLIQTGEFELELIAFEYDIPMETILEWKKELESQKVEKNYTTANNSGLQAEKRNAAIYAKAKEIEQRYLKLYYDVKKNKNVSKNHLDITNKQDDKKIELIKKTLFLMKKKIKSLEGVSESNERTILVKEMLSNFINLDTYLKLKNIVIPIDIIDDYIKILFSDEIQDFIQNASTYESKRLINSAKNIIGYQLSRTIDNKLEESNDIEELQALLLKLTPELIKSSISLNSTKRKIESKIISLKQANKSNNLKNNISINMKSIITDLINGELDIQNANNLIDIEAKEINRSRLVNNRFSITEEQDRKQILIQIRTAIRENERRKIFYK